MLTEGVLVLDLDDTLYLERDYVRSGLTAVDRFVREHFGVVGFADIAWEAFENGRRGDLFDHALQVLNVPSGKEHIATLVQIYRTHDPLIALTPDSERLLSRTPGSILTGLLSDGPLASQMAKIRALRLDTRIQHICCTDRWGREFWKPHARAYEAFRNLAPHLPAERFVYIADNPVKDFTAALAMGWWTLRIARRAGLHSALPIQAWLVHRQVENLDGVSLDRLTRGECP